MNTMIPNQLKFDLDLQDLPSRAMSVSSEVLSLSGGNSNDGRVDVCVGVEGFNKSIRWWPSCRDICSNRGGQICQIRGYEQAPYLKPGAANVTCQCSK